MRNSSDIFCLKSAKTGENDGSQIFSVKGATSLKINRKNNPSNSVFQFGQTNLKKDFIDDEPETKLNLIKDELSTKDNEFNKMAQPDELGGPGVEPGEIEQQLGDFDESKEFVEQPTETTADTTKLDNMGEQPSPLIKGNFKNTEQQNDSLEFKLLSPTNKITCNKTNMKRNILTGDGMDCVTYKTQKKNFKKQDDWLW